MQRIQDIVEWGSINIMEREYKIKLHPLVARDSAELGFSDSRDGTISLADTLEGGALGQVFLHEIIHAISDDLGIELPEQIVSALATGLYATLKRNELIG